MLTHRVAPNTLMYKALCITNIAFKYTVNQQDLHFSNSSHLWRSVFSLDDSWRFSLSRVSVTFYKKKLSTAPQRVCISACSHCITSCSVARDSWVFCYWHFLVYFVSSWGCTLIFLQLKIYVNQRSGLLLLTSRCITAYIFYTSFFLLFLIFFQPWLLSLFLC